MEDKISSLFHLKELKQAESQLKFDKERYAQEMEDLKEQLEGLNKGWEKEEKARIEEKKKGLLDPVEKDISQKEKEIKKAKDQRKKDKNAGVKNRILEETKDEREKMKEIQKEIRAAVQEEGVSAFCGGRFFFTIFYPHGLGEVCQVILYYLAFFLGLPAFLVCCLIRPEHKWVAWLIFIVFVVLALAIHITVRILTKDNHHEALSKLRGRYDEVVALRKEIGRKKRAIKRDQDESMYGLEGHDERLKDLGGQKDDLSDRLKLAKESFEEASGKIKKELEEKYKPEVDEKQRRLDELKGKIEAAKAQEKAVKEELKTNYSTYLEDPDLSIGKIDALLDIMKSRNIQNVEEAKDFYNQSFSNTSTKE